MTPAADRVRRSPRPRTRTITARLWALVVALALVVAPVVPTRGRAATGEAMIVIVLAPEGSAFDEAFAGFEAELGALRVVLKPVRIALGAGGVIAGEPLDARVAREQAELVLALGQGAVRLAREAKLTVPVVAGLVFDGDELRGAANVTGVFLEFPIERQLERLRSVLPGATSIGIVYDPKQNEARVRAAAAAAPKLGMRVEARPVSAARELPNALASLANTVSVVLGLPDSLVLTPETAREVLLFSFRNRIPFVGPSASWAKAGALYALHWDGRDVGRQLAELAADLHAGAPIASLPPRGPRSEVLTLNGKTADQLGVTFSLELRSRAQQVL